MSNAALLLYFTFTILQAEHILYTVTQSYVFLSSSDKIFHSCAMWHQIEVTCLYVLNSDILPILNKI
jgi:hypothetical protein